MKSVTSDIALNEQANETEILTFVVLDSRMRRTVVFVTTSYCSRFIFLAGLLQQQHSFMPTKDIFYVFLE